MKAKEFNNTVYGNNQSEENFELAARTKLAVKLIGKNKKVLDVGCYDGYISEKIRDAGNEVFGLEISKSAAKLCNARGIKCKEGNLEEKFPFGKNSFDAVFAGEIIEHLFDTDGFLQEIKRVLKPNGILVLSTPNLAALTRRFRLFFGQNPHIDIGLISPDGKEKSAGHLRYFTKKSLEKLLKRNGFAPEKWETDFILLHNLRIAALGKAFPGLGWAIYVRARADKK